jgi:EAL domain-containing protein (putative c-di-GMP-specific phosphodiesterase class I)
VIDNVRKLADRVDEFLTPRVGRLTLPYLREKPRLEVGYGFLLHSTLESEERQVLRLIDDAVASARLRGEIKDRQQREGLMELIYNRHLWTAFQPIVEIETRQIMGHEGLSRGPRGTDYESPMALFGVAARFGLVEELERSCRRTAFSDWEVYGAPGRLFVNTVPSTVRDASFQGRGVLDYLGPNLSPRLVTLEITERQVIENLGMYREAMHSFIDMGFTFAIDDVGSGYSGLETIANLGASYLKIDMGLVRDVHQKRTGQQVIKAILDMGAGVGATVIAEGIQTREEAEAIVALGVRYGQGYLFGRPVDPYAPIPKPRLVVKETSRS